MDGTTDRTHKHHHHHHHRHRRHHDDGDDNGDSGHHKHRRAPEEPVLRERKRARVEVADDEFPIEPRPAPAAAPRDPAAQAKTRRLAGLFAAQLRRLSAQGAAQQAQDAERARITEAAAAEAKERIAAEVARTAQADAAAAAADAAAVPAHDDRVVRCWHATAALAARFRVTSGPRPIYWAPKDLLRRLANAPSTTSTSTSAGDDDAGCGTALADLVAKDVQDGVLPRALAPPVAAK